MHKTQHTYKLCVTNPTASECSTPSESNKQHNTGLQLNRYRTKPKTSYNQTHNIRTHTYRQLQAITTNTCTQSAYTTQSQPAQKGQFITTSPKDMLPKLHDGMSNLMAFFLLQCFSVYMHTYIHFLCKLLL